MKYPNKTVCIIDFGLFLSVAQTLSKYFGRVLYYCQWQDAFPTTSKHCIGEGVEGVESIESIWGHIDDIDLFVYLDTYCGDEQMYLESIGKRVWGSRRGEQLETKRAPSKRLLESVGLDAGDWKGVTGMDALRGYLKTHKDQYVKISSTRGDAETFYAKTYQSIEPRLDELATKIGPYQDKMKFICESKIPDAVEIASDIYCVDGQFPTKAMYGIEAKSRGYVGHFTSYSEFPKQLQEMNAAVAPTLERAGYKNFFAMEARITKDGIAHVIDPCCRAGSPPSELLQIMYTNLADIFWYGSEGICIDPIPAAEWGAELMVHSTWAEHNWLPIDFPAKYKDNIKLRNFCVIDGKTYVAPGAVSIGAVVAVGKTKEEAQEKCKEVAKELSGCQVETEPEAFDEIDDEIKKLKEIGISF